MTLRKRVRGSMGWAFAGCAQWWRGGRALFAGRYPRQGGGYIEPGAILFDHVHRDAGVVADEEAVAGDDGEGVGGFFGDLEGGEFLEFLVGGVDGGELAVGGEGEDDGAGVDHRAVVAAADGGV